MSKETEKKPLSHRAPTTGPESSEPGLGSLAPKDGSHQPPAEPTPPGKQPTAPGSLKAPQTHNAKLDQLEASRKNGTNQPLTTNQGTRIANDQNSLRAGTRGPTLLEDFILRNLYLSQMRRARFKGEWDDLVADRLLAAPASQDKHVELADMQRALMHLPQPQREALILVGAGGFAYEEAAEICNVAVGTIKSRVARGRVALEALLSDGTLKSRRDHENENGRSTLDSIMGEVDDLARER